MSLNLMWGVGREPRVAGTPVITTIDDSSFDLNAGATPPTNTNTANIPSQTQIVGVSVTCMQMDRTQTCVNGRLVIEIDGKLVASYIMPTINTAGDIPTWFVNEVIPFSYHVVGSSILKATLSADNGGATGFIVVFKADAIGIAV